jgi:hypothetical protein
MILKTDIGYSADELTLIVEWRERGGTAMQTELTFDLTPHHNATQLEISIGGVVMAIHERNAGILVKREHSDK